MARDLPLQHDLVSDFCSGPRREADLAPFQLSAEQVERYAILAKANGIDAVITISNQLVARADHHPIKLPKRLLNKWGIDVSDISIDSDERALETFREVTQGARTVPQILIDDKLIGGFSELTELHMDGELDSLMRQD